LPDPAFGLIRQGEIGITDMPIALSRQKLGVGEIFGDAFSILFGNFFRLILLSVVPMVALFALGLLVIVPIMVSGAQPDSVAVILALLAIVLIFIAASYVTTALVVRLAYDAKTGHQLRMGSYFLSALPVLLPLLLCAIITGIAIIVGFLFFIVPGLYLMALWICVIPVIVLEKAGIGSLSRSAQLTRGYRWPCVGALLLLFLCLLGFSIVFNILEELITALGGREIALLVSVFLNGLTIAFNGIFAALVYARLREIKDGTSVEQLAEVFA